MSGYKTFAVVGAGNIGKFIIDELLNLKSSGKVSSVVVVSRSDAATPQWTSKGAQFAIIDYDSPSSITAAFTNVDVVISTVGGPAFTRQIDLITAAKLASVKLFIPSEFGGPTDNTTEGIYLEKRQVQTRLKELGLPYSLFYTGIFSDLAFIPPFGWDLANGKVNIGGEGNSPLSFTSRPDIARYLGHVLTTLPALKLEWRIFRIEGYRCTFNDVVAGYQNKTGKKLEVTYTPQSALKETLSKNPNDFLTFVKLTLDQGRGIVGDETDNEEWPEWNPKKVLDVIA